LATLLVLEMNVGWFCLRTGAMELVDLCVKGGNTLEGIDCC
jgi:hypothetical protein